MIFNFKKLINSINFEDKNVNLKGKQKTANIGINFFFSLLILTIPKKNILTSNQLICNY